jgi:putative FmdB family regulatory protein
MPIYTYRCESCGVQFEKFQKFSDQSLTRCPECGKKTLRKVYAPVGIVFKGSGFYSTDNRSPSGAPRTTASKSEEKSGDADKAAPTKPESKPNPEPKSSTTENS